MKIVKCQMIKYDANVQEPPYTFITVGEFEIEDGQRNKNGRSPDGGLKFSEDLRKKCQINGHEFKCYSWSQEEGIEYQVVVYGEMEQTEKYIKEEIKNKMTFSTCIAHLNDELTLEEAKAQMDDLDALLGNA